jgi:hypothetical protein
MRIMTKKTTRTRTLAHPDDPRLKGINTEPLVLPLISAIAFPSR